MRTLTLATAALGLAAALHAVQLDEFRAPEARAVRERHFGDAKPASTLVQIARLAAPEYKVEIEAIAVLP